MPYRTVFPRDLFADLDRLQREMQQAFDLSPSIRGLTRGFPALNVGGTAKSVEIYASRKAC
jgi:HSP20 family protein